MRLDPDDLRAYAARDWGAPERLALCERVMQPVEEKVRIAIALYEAARATRPDWPTEADRREDLLYHQRLKASSIARSMSALAEAAGRVRYFGPSIKPACCA